MLDAVPRGDIWAPLENINGLVEEFGSDLPPITWLIRSDESVRYATGHFASGYTHHDAMWESLRGAGHELGWHVHLVSHDASAQYFSFDPEPPWLDAAFGALSDHFEVQAVRTGWDFCNDWLMRKLDELGVRVDLSALPGNVAWHAAGLKKIRVDWLRSSRDAYHPAAEDYQSPGGLRILEIPITQFPNSIPGIITRVAWRLRHGCFAMNGLRAKTRMLTDTWPPTLSLDSEIGAFYFHPSDLDQPGRANFRQNLATLRRLPGTEFVTASVLASSVE